MPDTSYAIETESNGTLTAEFNAGDPNNWTTGGSASFTFELDTTDQTVVEEFAQWAGSFTTMEMLDNTVKFRDQLPSSATIDSCVLGINPSSDLDNDNIVGVWGLVESIDNQRNQPLTTNRYQFSLTVLAPYSEYADHTAVSNDLEI